MYVRQNSLLIYKQLLEALRKKKYFDMKLAKKYATNVKEEDVA